MAKVFIVYDTKYGNTKLVAEKIMEGIGEVGGVETSISDVENLDIEKVLESDAILIGSPNHMGRQSRTISNFMDKIGRADLKVKWAAVFDTYMGGDFEKAVKGMEAHLKEKAPSLKLIAPGLSVRVQGTKGPIAEGELQKCLEFGRKIPAQLRY